VLALAPGAVIVNLAGNGLNGMGVALLQLGRPAQAMPLLLAALAIRAETEDLEQQHIDLVHLAAAALALGNSSIATRIARFLDGHPATLQPGCTGTTDARCGQCSTRPPASTPTPRRASTRPGG
jgi:hypothetical protein